MTRTLLSFGHGYTSSALARHILPKGWRIIGTTRSPERLQSISDTGVEAILFPGGDLAGALADATHILSAVAPGDEDDPVLAALASEFAEIAPSIQWVGYLSTTGVYGDHRGGWVDEDTLLDPATERGRKRVVAEAQWQQLAHDSDLPIHIFRLAGIYGPGRGPFAKIRNGSARRIVKLGQVFSRIHVEDLVRVLSASIARPLPGAVYNVCDDEPAPPEDVIAHAAELLGLPVPPVVAFEDAELSPMARSFYAESKRVRNDRMKRELGVRLLYPNYRAGLRALLEKEAEYRR